MSEFKELEVNAEGHTAEEQRLYDEAVQYARDNRDPYDAVPPSTNGDFAVKTYRIFVLKRMPTDLLLEEIRRRCQK